MLNKMDDRNINTFVITLGNQSVRFDYSLGDSNQNKVITQSINDLKDFLNKWKSSTLAKENIYVSLPLLHNNKPTYNNADKLYSFYVNYMRKVEETVVDLMGQTFWDNDFAGFFFRTEGIYPINEEISSTSPTSNPMVKLMNDLSYRIRNTYERYFMWCPYYGYNTYRNNIIKNLGIVANRTDIFDVICIQPATYYHDAPSSNVDLVYDSASSNEVVDQNGNPVAGGRRSSATAYIGVNMEADNYFDGSKSAIFDDYISTFKPLVREVPIVFYANTLEATTANPDLMDAIAAFYD